MSSITVGTFGTQYSGNEGISNAIMGKLGFATIYNAGKVNSEVFKAGYTWVVGFMGIILFLVTAFVMFSLAFVLIARFVILLLLIIVAPIGFAGLAIPNLKGTADMWWDALIKQTITAPVLLLLLYIALRIITDVNFLTFGSTGNWTGFVPNPSGGTDYSAVVIFSKKLSAFGADKASTLAGKLSFGATAWAGRNTVGWGAHKFANMSRRFGLANVPIVGTRITRGLDRVATGSFDLRGVKQFGGLKATGVDTGEAQKGGYRADLKERVESRTKYASELKGRELNDKEKAEQAYWQNEVKKLERNKKNATSPEQIKDINDGIKEIEKKQLERIEKVTDKGAQRKYASNLELGYLGLTDKSFFNKYINFAANTEAIKIIRAKAKKDKPDKDWTANMKNMLKEAAKESGEEEDAGTVPTTTPPVAAPTTPPPGGGTSGGGTSSTS